MSVRYISDIVPAEGSVTPTDFNIETTVVEFTDTKEFFVRGYLSLENMASDDAVEVREYVIIQSGGAYKLLDKGTYSGVQGAPLVRFPTKLAVYGYKVTIVQTAGTTLKSFPYQFRKFEVS